MGTDISVHDKEVAALGATEEEQDMSTLNRVIVPMPAFTDPNLPEAASGSVNQALSTHAVEHSEDYGAAVDPGAHEVLSTMDGGSESGRGEDRADWTKEDWKEQCRAYGLPVSGNMDELQARVEEYEKESEQ